MVIVCTQPAIDYYGWQVDIFLHSIGNLNIGYENVHVLFSNVQTNSPTCLELSKKYPAVNFVYYDDDRDYKSYIPSIKQHLMYKHFLANPWLENEIIFHVDSDVAFTKPINFNNLVKDDIWYTSDTISYLGYDYILSKGRNVLDTMLSIADIDEELVKSNQNNSGGAQYLFKNVDTNFWLDVVNLSHELFSKITELNKQEVKSHNQVNTKTPYVPLQIWTAEMWAILWTAWKRGKQTKVVKELDFTWATDPIEKWYTNSIFHNAGVVNNTSGMFYKGDYINKSPKDINLVLDQKKASYNYYEMLKKALW